MKLHSNTDIQNILLVTVNSEVALQRLSFDIPVFTNEVSFTSSYDFT